jgi:predicted ATP-grasp superfamily ATP-dependent carboligase
MAARRPTPDKGAIIPAINTASSTAALRSLGRRNVHTLAISEHDTPPGYRSKFCREAVSVPDPAIALAAYEETLLELAQRPDVQTILPFREVDIYVLARNKQAFADHVQTPWPELDTLRRVQDRVELFETAHAAGVATPTTERYDEWDDWTREAIVKPRYTVHATEYSSRFSKTHAQGSSTRYLAPDERPDREAMLAEMGHLPIVQEYVPAADEYGFFALYDHGEPVATFQHRQRRGWKYCGGPSAYRESVDIPELRTAGLRLLDELEWHGVAMVEFLRNPATGAFELMEVNPRFWSSLPFTVQAGVDFPALYWQQATGDPIEAPPKYEVGVAGHLLRGEVLHLHSILADDYPLVDRPSFERRAVSTVASLVRDRHFDYLDVNDPGPFVQDLRNAAEELLAERASASAQKRSTGLRATLRTFLSRYR